MPQPRQPLPANQTLLLTVMPGPPSVVGDTLPVSVVVSPRLTGAPTLDAFADLLAWTSLLKNSGMELAIDAGGRTTDVAIDREPLRPDLWTSLFSARTRVDDYEFDDYSDRTVISYPVREAMLAVKAVYQEAAKELGLPADPRDVEDPQRRAGTLTSLLDGMQLDAWSDTRRRILRRVFGKRVANLDEPRFEAGGRLPVGADGLPGAAQLASAPGTTPLFKQQLTAQFALYHRMPPGAPIAKPDMQTLLDFHKAISALSAYPPLLRALGLVFDVDLPADAVALTGPAAFGRLSVAELRPGWEAGLAIDARPTAATAYRYMTAEDGRTYWFPSPSETTRRGSVLGLLDLDPDSFCLAQFDVDGAMHKLMTLAAGVPASGSKLAPALQPAIFDDANTVPSLRSAGVSLVQDDRARALLESMAASKRFNERLNGDLDDDTPFFAEDLVRGYRLDVWDSFDATWRSLHRRSGRYEFEDVVFESDDEEGYTQLAVAQPAPDPALETPNDDLYLHEAVARWAGWSLSVPPPGKAISRNPDPDRAVPPDDPADREPDDRQHESVTPFKLKTTFRVTPRSLPALRFGRRYRLRARVVDLAGNSLALDDPLALEADAFAIPHDEDGFAYLRYEPVSPPQLVRRDDLAITGPGSALDRLVIRTHNSDPSLDTAAADLSGSERHIMPPRTSIELAERHGLLDDLSGRLKGDAATYRMLVERDDELASQFPRAPVPGQAGELPILAAADVATLSYVPDPLSRSAALRDLPGAPEHTLGSVGAAAAIDYAPLDDPNPRPGSVTLVDFENTPDWLRTRGFRLTLASGARAPGWDPARRVLTVFLPAGSTAIVPLSSAMTPDDLKLMGIWQWLREYLADLAGPEQIRFEQGGAQDELATLLQRLVEGGHWMLTPPTLLTLVSAVQQPIGHPRFKALSVQRPKPSTVLRPLSLRNREFESGGEFYDPTPEQMEPISAWREPGALDAYLIGALRVHGQSTARVDLFAQWEEWIDDPARPEDPPVREPRSGFVDAIGLNDPGRTGRLHAPGSDRLVGVYDPTRDLIAFTTGGDVVGRDPALRSQLDAAPRHYLDDTKHRRIGYTATASSRFSEYFPADQDLDFTRSSEPVTVNVPASARPPSVSVRYVVPTFGWERQESTNVVRSVRYGGGVRVYLDRPWYESGEGELLGVVVWLGTPPDNQAREHWKLFVTQWGTDPTWLTQPASPSMPSHANFPQAVAGEDLLRLAESVPNDRDGRPGLVGVAGHEVAFDAQRKLWYCDITIDCPTYSPFVRLALTRYQPHAIAEAKLSQVVLTDFVQLTPDRSVLVSADPYRPRELRLSVTGSAPSGPPPDGAGASPGRPTNVRIRVQHRAAPDLGDFAWRDIDDDAVARVDTGETTSDEPGTMLWSGSVVFGTTPAAGSFRLLIEEREYVSADHVATGAIGGAPPDRHVSVAPGRLIYADIVALGASLTVVPAPQATVAAIAGERPAAPEGGGLAGVDPRSRVIVQLRADVDIPYADGLERVLAPMLGAAWDAIVAAFPFIALDRVFAGVDPDDLDRLFGRAGSELGSALPLLHQFFALLCPLDVDPEVVAAALRPLSEVFERVYVESRAELPIVDFANDPLVTKEFYLDPAPTGFDAKFAWTQSGGDGDGVSVADVEHNWDREHEDLVAASTRFVTDEDAIPLETLKEPPAGGMSFRDHGTASLGVMVAADNTVGGVGIVPRASVLLASGYRKLPDGTVRFDEANAAIVASAALQPGDVLLIELEGGNDFTPIETDPHVFAAIAAVTARGITVIEPGGNGPGNGSLGRFFDLDTLVVASVGIRALNRDVGLDSGAVIVAACQSGVTSGTIARSPTDYSPRGKRIDCFAYGEHVWTTSGVQPLEIRMGPAGRREPNPFAGQPYTWAFAGTSSASALIAGVAVAVQGLAKAILGRPLSPSEVRQVLSDRTLNTPSAKPDRDRIGVMPDLREIIGFLKRVKSRGVITGTWVTVRTGHELVYLGQRRVLDWVPSARTWDVWPYESLAISGDPLPAPALKSATWSTIGTGHTLTNLGGDLVLDHVAATGDYRLFKADWSQPDFLPGPALAKGTWLTIRDRVVGGVAQQHRLAYLGGDHVLDWVPQDRTFRVWRLDRRGVRQDPLLGRPVAGPGGTITEAPLAEGAFADARMNATTQILAISSNKALVWHGDTGAWRVLFYDRTHLQPQTFTDSPRGGTWNTIRTGHVLLWLGELGNGQLLDWEPTTGRYRLFPDVPDTA